MRVQQKFFGLALIAAGSLSGCIEITSTTSSILDRPFDSIGGKPADEFNENNVNDGENRIVTVTNTTSKTATLLWYVSATGRLHSYGDHTPFAPREMDFDNKPRRDCLFNLTREVNGNEIAVEKNINVCEISTYTFK